MANITKLKFLGIVFRLSLAISIGATVFDAYQIHQLWVETMHVNADIKFTLDCAIKIPEGKIQSYKNEFGNIDVAKLGCRAGSDGETFFVTLDELQRHRAGEFLLLYQNHFDFESNVDAFFFFFLCTNIVGVMLVAAYALSRWIIGWDR